MQAANLCGSEYEEFLIRMEEFHGYRSPGILLGGLILDASLKKLGPTGPCPECGESYPLNHRPTCPACRGDAYYTYRVPSEDE